MKINSKQYAQVLYDLTANKSEVEVDSVVKKFAEELKRNRRLKLAGEIIKKFSDIYNRKNEIAEVEVVSAHKLESSQIYKVESYIKEKYKTRKVVLKNKVDKNIKGGIIIKAGDEVIDGSTSGQLRKLKIRLLEA